MKKMSFLFAAVSLLLTACSEEEKISKENEYQVKDIRFEKERGFFGNSHIYIDTEKETFVLSPWEMDFMKTNEDTTINIKLINEKTFLDEWTEEEITIYLNEQEVSEISKKYASEFKETLEFIDGKEK